HAQDSPSVKHVFFIIAQLLETEKRKAAEKCKFFVTFSQGKGRNDSLRNLSLRPFPATKDDAPLGEFHDHLCNDVNAFWRNCLENTHGQLIQALLQGIVD